jgi:hypothetical protein
VRVKEKGIYIEPIDPSSGDKNITKPSDGLFGNYTSDVEI